SGRGRRAERSANPGPRPSTGSGRGPQTPGRPHGEPVEPRGRATVITHWSSLTAPTLDDIEAIARAAYEALPETFRRLAGTVPIVVTDFPDEATMDEMGCESEFDLLGLFRGVGLPQGGDAGYTGQLPNQIWLYRRPILDYWAEHDDTLGE